MVNLAPHHSIGATYGWVFDAIYPATVFEGRYRYWLVRWLAAEAGGGKLWGRNGGPDGVVAHIAIDAADIGTLTITFERLATSTGDETRALFGVRFGLPALGIAAAVASGSRQGPF
jgi:hypothetical protein